MYFLGSLYIQFANQHYPFPILPFVDWWSRLNIALRTAQQYNLSLFKQNKFEVEDIDEILRSKKHYLSSSMNCMIMRSDAIASRWACKATHCSLNVHCKHEVENPQTHAERQRHTLATKHTYLMGYSTWRPNMLK